MNIIAKANIKIYTGKPAYADRHTGDPEDSRKNSSELQAKVSAGKTAGTGRR